MKFLLMLIIIVYNQSFLLASFQLVDNAIEGFDQNSYKMMKGSLAAGDLDGDGDLDFIGCGLNGTTPITKLFINNHFNPLNSGKYFSVRESNPNPGLIKVYYSSIALGDYDNDGYLDVAIAGYNGSMSTIKLYHNDTVSWGVHDTLRFVEDTARESSLPAVGYNSNSCALDWGDYNNDGKIDLLVAGYNGTTRITKIYKNTRNAFVETISLLGVSGDDGAQGFAKFCDYNNDGKLDLAVTGNIGGGLCKMTIYSNDGNTNFIDTGHPILMSTNLGNRDDFDRASFAWGDIDNNGYFDLFAQGHYDNRRNGIYCINQGPPSYNFLTYNSSFVINGNNHEKGQLLLGDVSNDGKLDLIYSGFTFGAPFNYFDTHIYLNNGSGSLNYNQSISGPALPGAPSQFSAFSALILGDFKNNGRLDLIEQGTSNWNGQILHHYQNDNAVINSYPSPPTQLYDIIWTGNNVTFSWSQGSDVETPTVSLTYNLRVGTSLHGCEIFSSEYSVSSTGVEGPGRGFGNVWHNTNWTIKGLDPNKVYYYEVQTVDNGFARSPWKVHQIPGMTWIKPGGINELAQDNYQIVWNDIDNRDIIDKISYPAKISFYYDNDKTGHDGILIANDVDIEDVNNYYNWDVVSVDNGIYYIYSKLTWKDKIVLSYAPGSIRIEQENQRIKNTVINPDKGEKFSFDFKLSQSVTMEATIYNLQGEEIIKLVSHETFNAGNHRIEWSGDNANHHKVSFGVYVLVIRSDIINEMIKIAIIK